jgi:hypothetical protein
MWMLILLPFSVISIFKKDKTNEHLVEYAHVDDNENSDQFDISHVYRYEFHH